MDLMDVAALKTNSLYVVAHEMVIQDETQLGEKRKREK